MTGTVPLPFVVTAQRPLTPDTTLYTICGEADHSAASFLPGQFLELSLPAVGEIPISYCGHPTEDGTIELCIRHGGHVTTALRGLSVGDPLAVRGPFGHGFPLEIYGGQDLLLIAGGLGMAPLRSLLLALIDQRERWGELIVLYGARESGALLFVDELRELARRGDISITLAVDRPVAGEEKPPDCRIALLPELLKGLSIKPQHTCAALCGPPAVYPYLLSGLKQLGLADERIHISLERRMKCGLGHCGHCAVGLYLCCTDGPVFSVERLRGIEGAFT